MIVMVEIPLNRREWVDITRLKDFYRVAVRGVLNQGKLMKEQHGSRSSMIVDRIAEITEFLRPNYIVIGPRTVEQLQDYRPLWIVSK
jgi:hypothetical protein